MTYFGAQQRYGSVVGEVRRQLERELALIAKLGFSGYFLIVWDLCSFARERGSLVQGRGSAANSAVCYALGITAVDPIESKLLFERFLSEGRTDWPDIDLDLPSGERREELIQEVYRRYGRRGAAMTANVITYRGRSTMREVGKVFGFPDDALDRFSSLFHGGDLPQTLELGGAAADGGRVRLAPEAARPPRHLPPGARPAAPPGAALGGDGPQPGGPRPVRAAGERPDAGALRPAVGQERHRGHGAPQGGPARARA